MAARAEAVMAAATGAEATVGQVAEVAGASGMYGFQTVCAD